MVNRREFFTQAIKGLCPSVNLVIVSFGAEQESPTGLSAQCLFRKQWMLTGRDMQ